MRQTIEQRLGQMRDDLRELVNVLNLDESYAEARKAQAAMENVADLAEDLPVNGAAWPPRIVEGSWEMPEE